jgi:hypothetical protein
MPKNTIGRGLTVILPLVWALESPELDNFWYIFLMKFSSNFHQNDTTFEISNFLLPKMTSRSLYQLENATKGDHYVNFLWAH